MHGRCLQQQQIKLYSTHFIFCVWFFTSGGTAKKPKAFLIQEFEKMEQALLQASTDKAGTTKVAGMEAGSASKSFFSRLYDRVLDKLDEYLKTLICYCYLRKNLQNLF